MRITFILVLCLLLGILLWNRPAARGLVPLGGGTSNQDSQVQTVIPESARYPAVLLRPGQRVQFEWDQPLAPRTGQEPNWQSFIGRLIEAGTNHLIYEAPRDTLSWGYYDELRYVDPVSRRQLEVRIVQWDAELDPLDTKRRPGTRRSTGGKAVRYQVPTVRNDYGFQVFAFQKDKKPVQSVLKGPEETPLRPAKTGERKEVGGSIVDHRDYPKPLGWKTVGKLNITIDNHHVKWFRRDYPNAPIFLGMRLQSPLKARDIHYFKFQFVDVWDSGSDGKWVYRGTGRKWWKGIGREFLPVWASCLKGWKPNGEGTQWLTGHTLPEKQPQRHPLPTPTR